MLLEIGNLPIFWHAEDFYVCYLCYSFQNYRLFEAVRCLWRWFTSPLLLKAVLPKAGHPDIFPVKFGISLSTKTTQLIWTTYATV